MGMGTGIPYLYLVPLIVIIPSFAAHMTYNKCVNKAGMYLQCYWESQDGFPIQWETRNSKYEKKMKNIMNSGTFVGKDTYKSRTYMPYYLCATICFVLYFSNILFGIWEGLMERTSAFVQENLVASGIIGTNQSLPDYYPIRVSDIIDMVNSLDWSDLNLKVGILFICFQIVLGVVLFVYCHTKMSEKEPDLDRSVCINIWDEVHKEELEETKG